MSDSLHIPHAARTLLSSFLLIAWSGLAIGCAKEEPEPQPIVEEVDQTPSTATDEDDPAQGAEAAGVEEGTETEEQEPTKLGGSSLRDRITVEPAPPEKPSRWSTAQTVEERRANLDKALSAEQPPYVIDMHDLGGWEVDEREEQPIPDYVLALDGKEFIVHGFMMPDIDFEHIREFHLVRSLYSCCFGAPPQLNEIMRVTLADEDGMEYTYNTIEVRGILRIEFEVIDGLVEDIFRMENATYRILDFDDPDAPSSFDAPTGFQGVVPTGVQEF